MLERSTIAFSLHLPRLPLHRRFCVPVIGSLFVIAAPIAVSAEPSDQLQEVIVTATKRAQPLQDVPAAVSALTGESLAAMNAVSFVDFARTVPGLTFTDAGAGRQSPAIRGVNATVGSRTVGYYIGETAVPDTAINAEPTPDTGLVNPYLIDIDRIEVLRGPQGTLYGSGSMGGTIKLVPNQPDLSKFEGSVQGTAMVTQGEHGASPGGEGDLILNVPIVEGVAGVRGVAWGRNVGGYIDRTYGYVTLTPPEGTVANLPDEHTWGFRGLLLVQPSEQLSITALAYLQHQHYDGFSDITAGPTNPGNHLVQVFPSDTPEPQENNFNLYSVDVNFKFDHFDFVSSTAYYQGRSVADMEGSSATLAFLAPPAFPNTASTGSWSHQFSQEMRLATSRSVYGFDAVIGGFYSTFGATGSFLWQPPDYNKLVAGNNPSNPLYAPDNVLFNNGSTTYQRQSAAFGELTYHPTDALSATVGMRHYRVTNDTNLTQYGYFLTPGSIAPDILAWSGESTGNAYKGNLSYKVTPDHLLYAQYSEGFRPGFGNAPPPAICNGPSAATQVNPDSTKNYELGAKNMWLDKRLSVNAAVYRIDWNDIQQSRLLPCGFMIIANFGSARIKGAELEVNDQVTKHLSAGLTGTYLNAELQQSVPSLGALAGDQIEQVPNWQFSLYGDATYTILQGNDGFTRLDFQYTGPSWGNYNRLSDGERDPTSKINVVRLLNIKSGIRYRSWEFSGSVTNLLNQVAIESIDPNASITLPIPGRPRLVVTRPRTFFLNALCNF